MKIEVFVIFDIYLQKNYICVMERYRKIINKPHALSFRLSAGLYEEIMKKAKKEGRSITSIISEAIAAFFNKN